MSFKVTKSGRFQKLIKEKNLARKVMKDFDKVGPLKVKQAIVQDMIKGISPVKGGGKWKKYSQSYKDVIRNKAAFRIINGKLVAIRADGGISNKEFSSLKGSKQAKGALNKLRARNKAAIEKLNKGFHAKSSPTKKVSPVNLRHSGGLHKSLRVFRVKRSLVIQFDHELADIHNRRGAGKSKVIRRLLPTNKGERFNKKITKVMFDELKKSADRVVNKL